MEFSESRQAWSPVPSWVRFLIDFGYVWPRDEARPRRIALISMPCDSAGAGLVALGAMICGLASPNANDLDGHYEALTRYTRQYLESCRACDMRCRPQAKGCGYTTEVSGRVRYKGEHLYAVSERTDLVRGEIWFFGQGVDRWLNPPLSIDWQIEGEPLPQLVDETEALPEQVYDVIVDGAQIVAENLQRSFSGLCLAGRVAGEIASREAYASIKFHIGDMEYGLPGLLTVHGWHNSREVSRVTFFNARTQEIGRSSYAPALVVADGDLSFLRVLDRPEFQTSDVIGVIHRIIERDNLESIGNRMLGLRQWYDDDTDSMEWLPNMPKGVSVAILKRRTW